MRSRAGVALVAAVALTVGVAGPAVAARSTVDKKQVQANLDRMTASGALGVQARISADGRDFRARSGVARSGAGGPVSYDSRFRAASVTKPFVATVVLQLVGEGRVALDRSVSTYLPGLLPDGDRITVRNLLQHTSGLYDYLRDLYATPEEQERGLLRHWEPRQLLALATAKPLDFPPGAKWEYSNTNYVVLGQLIERVTGRSWRDEVQRRVLKPVGMRDSSIPTDRVDLPWPHAHGYLYVDGRRVDGTRLNPTSTDAAGALVSTTADLDRFWTALFGGRLLKPAQQAELTRTTAVSPTYGLGVEVHTLACGQQVVGHSGDMIGWLTEVFGTPDGRTRLVLSANLDALPEPDYSPVLDVVDSVFCPKP
ncbi:serine hydrolase domain-containing protein [Actinosynnema sp. NPDC020468]|uniref:serine hydrolase domain-containing protein n=1 Tax=Actinosynnema sp. NPDC020468 TaxID=3154488 RepID=UPI0033DB5C8A